MRAQRLRLPVQGRRIHGQDWKLRLVDLFSQGRVVYGHPLGTF
jgi:hypothetical protein